MKKGMALFGICLLFFCCVPMKVDAAEDVDFDTEREEMLRYLEDEDVFGDLEGLAKQETGITFSQLTGLIAENGVMGSLREIGDYVLQSLIGEIRTNRQNMIHVLVLVLLFCVLQNFLELTDNSYISELCYMLTYLVMMLLLLKSFSVTAQIVRDMLDTVTRFMRMLLPAYLGVMVFAGSAMSAMSFYELTFFILYGIEMIMTYFLLPLISVYVLFQLANYTLKDEVFSKTADLIHDLFGWGAKIILTLVVGLNVVQSMIVPAVDYASRTTLTKSLGLIPGIGGAASAIGDILIGSGMVIKNSVGVAAIFLLLFLTLVPFIKVLIITFLYKCMAAFLEPIADKRIAKAMAGMATGGGMLMRMITTTVFMIFITIAMISATSSFMA
ncbi:MAG: stage III sporulation protein AE [Lachnospiraceae bacterium]